MKGTGQQEKTACTSMYVRQETQTKKQPVSVRTRCSERAKEGEKTREIIGNHDTTMEGAFWLSSTAVTPFRVETG